MIEGMYCRSFVRMSKWKPNADSWSFLFSLLDDVSKEKVTSFHFQRDAKASLIGKIISKYYLHLLLHSSPEDIHFRYSARGRPSLSSHRNTVDFNVSHNGDMVAFASNPWPLKVGVDVMEIRPPGNRTILQFIGTFKSQFDPDEFAYIHSGETEHEKLHNFFRLWCLKESVIKATGTGLGLNLARLKFSIYEALKDSDIITSSQVSLDACSDQSFSFEESLIDNDYCITASNLLENPSEPLRNLIPSVKFTEMNFVDIIPQLQKFQLSFPPDVSAWESYISKPFSPHNPIDPAV